MTYGRRLLANGITQALLFLAVLLCSVTASSAVKFNNVYSIHSDVVMLDEKPELFSHIEEDAKVFLIPQRNSEKLFAAADQNGWNRIAFGHLAKLGTLVNHIVQREFFQMSSFWVHETIVEEDDDFMPMLAFAVTTSGKMINTRIQGLIDLSMSPADRKFETRDVKFPDHAFSGSADGSAVSYELAKWFCDLGHPNYGPLTYVCGHCGECRKDSHQEIPAGIHFKAQEMPDLLPYFENPDVVCPNDLCQARIPGILIDPIQKVDSVCPNCEQPLYIDRDGKPRSVEESSGEGEVVESRDFYFDNNPTAEQVEQALDTFKGSGMHISELKDQYPELPWLQGEERGNWRPRLPGDKPGSSSGILKKGLIGTGIGGGVSLLVYGIVQLATPSMIEATPQRIFWQTSTPSQVFDRVSDSGWTRPVGGGLVPGSVTTSREIRTTRRVPDETETINHPARTSCTKVKSGGGYQNSCRTTPARTETRTKYRSEPVYDTKYYWQEDRWVRGRSFSNEGERGERIVPVRSVQQRDSAGRPQRLLASYSTSYKVTMTFMDKDGNPKQGTFHFENRSDWERIQEGVMETFKVRGSTILEIIEK